MPIPQAETYEKNTRFLCRTMLIGLAETMQKTDTGPAGLAERSGIPVDALEEILLALLRGDGSVTLRDVSDNLTALSATMHMDFELDSAQPAEHEQPEEKLEGVSELPKTEEEYEAFLKIILNSLPSSSMFSGAAAAEQDSDPAPPEQVISEDVDSAIHAGEDWDAIAAAAPGDDVELRAQHAEGDPATTPDSEEAKWAEKAGRRMQAIMAKTEDGKDGPASGG